MNRIAASIVLGLVVAGCTGPGRAPGPVAPVPDGPGWYLYDAHGAPVPIETLVELAGVVDALFVGERHNDPGAHEFQLDLFRALLDAEDGKGSDSRTVVLSLEMFERDVQVILDEYLSDLITEVQFLASARPWANYRSDYRPLVELARDRGVSVVAANAPRRYANRVSRLGREALEDLSEEAMRWLPPFPYPGPSEAYRADWDAIMGEAGQHGMAAGSALDAQALWDASMGLAIHEALARNPGALVLHLAGAFHVERATGTPEALRHYRAEAGFVVVTVRPVEDPTAFELEAHLGLGDYIVLTDARRLP